MRLLAASLVVHLGNALPHSYPHMPMHGVTEVVQMPLVGIGTWQYNDTVAKQAIIDAFSSGYRHVDTAYVYGNQVGVGEGLAIAAESATIKRDEYFVTSKIPGTLNETATWAVLEETLAQLKLNYVDLMLIHFPAAAMNATGAAQRKSTWTTLEKWAKQGKAKAIGVSHHCKAHIEDILQVATLPVALNQEQYHVGMGMDTQPRKHDLFFDRRNKIVYMSYSSLCGPCPKPDNMELLTGKLVTGIGKKHNKTGAQVALRWLVQQGIPIIPKSSNPVHIRENFDLFDFVLTDAEMDQLSRATSPAETGTSQNPDDAQDCAFEEKSQLMISV